MSSSEFPENILDTFATFFAEVEGVEEVVLRNIREVDPNGTLAISLDEWIAVEEEMNGRGNFEPTIVSYNMALVHMVKNGNKVEGQKVHRNVAKAIRQMLYRDIEMQLALRALHEDDEEGFGRTRVLRWSIIGQKFASNEIDNNFVSVSSTEVNFVTETV